MKDLTKVTQLAGGTEGIRTWVFWLSSQWSFCCCYGLLPHQETEPKYGALLSLVPTPPPPNRWPQQSCAGARAGRSAALGASQRLDSEQQQQHLREDAETEAWLHQARSWGRGLQAPRRQRGTEQETAGVSGEETCAVTGWSSG